MSYIPKDTLRDPANGYYTIEPAAGGWFADLLFQSLAQCPIFDKSDLAVQWALLHGGKRQVNQ